MSRCLVSVRPQPPSSLSAVLRFQPDRLRSELEALSPSSRAVFAALCARRLAHRYTVGGARLDASALERFAELHRHLWDLATAVESDHEAAAAAAAQALVLIPAGDDADLFAEDAAAALVYALRTLASGEAEEAVWAAERACDALESFLQQTGIGLGADGGEELLVRHPLMQAELVRQADDVRALRDVESRRLPGAALHQLRDRADAAGPHIFG